MVTVNERKLHDEFDKKVATLDKRRTRIFKEATIGMKQYVNPETHTLVRASTAEMMDTLFAIDDEDIPDTLTLMAAGYKLPEIIKELELDIPDFNNMSDEDYERFIDETEAKEKTIKDDSAKFEDD